MSSLLLALSGANFVIGMGAFMVVGMLTPVSAAFGVDAAAAGWLMSIYALVYAVTSPLLVAITGRVDRRVALACGLGVFGAGAVLAAVAPSFPLLLGGRAVMALGGGLVTPVAAAIAVFSSPPDHRGRALAMVFGGLTLAQVLGVPAGAWLSYAVGWQAAFVVVAVLALSGLAALLLVVPARLAVPVADLATLGRTLATPRLVLAVGLTAVIMAAIYTVYTYLAPLLEARHGLGRDGVSIVLLLFGAAAVLGNAVGGFASDRFGPRATLAAVCIGEAIALPTVSLAPLPLPAMVGVIIVWSILGWAFMVPQQARLAGIEPRLTPVLLSLNAAFIYVGASLGSALGGQVIRWAGLPMVGVAGAVVAVLALATLLWRPRGA